MTSDYGGGWKVPGGARVGVDTAYLLFAVGLLAERGDGLADPVAQRLVDSYGVSVEVVSSPIAGEQIRRGNTC